MKVYSLNLHRCKVRVVLKRTRMPQKEEVVLVVQSCSSCLKNKHADASASSCRHSPLVSGYGLAGKGVGR